MTQTARIGLISAVEFEAGSLLARMGGGDRIVYMASGLGVANAAHAATVMAERHRPDVIVNFGIGGAYVGSGLTIGDVAAATEEVYADTGLLMPDGPHGLDAIGLPLLKQGQREFFNRFPLDKALAKKAAGVATASGLFLTVNMATGSASRAGWLMARNPGALVENMEGAAVAHICMRYGIAAVEIRGISNMVTDRDMKTWDMHGAAAAAQEAVERFIALIS